MSVQVVDGLGEDLRRILTVAPRAFVAGDQEDLVHADVEGIGREGIDQLVDQGEDHAVHVRMERAPAPAVDPLVVLGHLGRLVELRVLREQRRCVAGPRLVAQAVEHGDEPDPSLAAEGGQIAGVGLAPAAAVAELGMRLELIPVVDLQHDGVDAERLETLVDGFLESGKLIASRRHQVHAAPGGLPGEVGRRS